MAADKEVMTARTRNCRECGDAFPLTRIDQVLCVACVDDDRDVRLIVQTLVSARRPTLSAVALATGISLARIHELTAAGRLSGVSVGTDSPAGDDLVIATSCVCQPGTVGRCIHCQMRLAKTFADATSGATPHVATARRGMHNRPSDGGRRRS